MEPSYTHSRRKAIGRPKLLRLIPRKIIVLTRPRPILNNVFTRSFHGGTKFFGEAQDSLHQGCASILFSCVGGPKTLEINISINGESRTFDVEPRTLLVHLLRDNAGLTGTHVACETSICGACTVLLDDKAVKKAAPSWPRRRKGVRSRPSRDWPMGINSIPCKNNSGRSTACNAASARRA